MYARTKLVYCAFFVITLGIYAQLFGGIAFGEKIPNSSSKCSDVLLVFARGSGNNPSALFTNDPYGLDFSSLEKVPGAFIKAFQNKVDNEYPLVTYKAVSVHNFPNLYSQNGYKAVGAFSARTFLNAVQAEFSWFPFGSYNASVGDGKEETAGYIKDQIALCPNQLLVLGGYSQGAQVMGESVFMLSSAERQKVAALALFGDPKYVGSDISNSSSSLNWFDSALSIFSRPKAKPWKRGSAGLNDRGLADARIPYVPSDLENKTISWCFNDDFVCSGGSGIFQTIITSVQNLSLPSLSDYTNGHNRYATFGAPQAASEVVQRLAPSFSDLDKLRGGVDPNGSPSQPVPVSPNSKPIDIMMMLNTSAGVDDVLGQMRLSSIEVMQPLRAYFNNVLYGIGEYSETGDLPNKRIPRVTINQNLTSNLEALNNRMYRSLAFGWLSGGGLDPPDPHQIGIERAVMSTNWREDSEKHIVLITPRMPLSPYTYNICSSDVRIGFGIDFGANLGVPNPNKCGINPALETDLAKNHPERCLKVYDALTKTNCSVEMANPWHTYNVVRKTDDAIALAQAKGIMIDVVVPSTIYAFYDSTTGINYSVPTITAALKKIAESTGGVFLQYNSFTKANYTDMYWRILNHKSRIMPFAAIEEFDTAGSMNSLNAFQPKTLKTKTPILFDAGSGKVSDQYKWDFNGDGVWDETTDSPNTDYVYETAIASTFAVVVEFNDGVETSRSILPLSVTSGESRALVSAPELPENLKIVRGDSGVIVSWDSGGEDVVLFFADPESGLPIVSSPVSSDELTIAGVPESLTSLVVWTEDEDARSGKVSLAIEEPAPPPVVVVVEVKEESTKILVESESRPNSQFIGAAGSTVQSSSSSSTAVLQQALQSFNNVTEVKASESVGKTVQQAISLSESDLEDDIDQSEPQSSNNLVLFGSIGILVFVLIAGIWVFKPKD